MFIREVVTGQKTGKPVRYAQIVEAYRNEDGKSRHRVLLSLGRVDRIDKPALERLVSGLNRYLERHEVPPGARVGEVRDYGLLYLLDAVWHQLGAPAALARLLKSRRFEIAVERALFAMVAHRLADPSSKLACAEWLARDAWLPAAQRLTVHQLYRAMDFLEQAHEDLELAIFKQRRTSAPRVQVVYVDTTSTYFELDDGRGADAEYGLRQRGYSRDEKPDRRQVVVALATDQHGLPIVSEVFSGDTHDALTVVPLLTRLQALGLRDVVWIADRGLASDDNLAAIRAAGLDYVVGVKLRAADALRDVIVADAGAYAPAGDGLMAKDVRVGGRRYVVCFAPASAQRDLALRLAAVERVQAVLDQVNAAGDSCDITRNGWYARLCSRHGDRWVLDKHKLDREAACDGVFVLEVSRATMTAADAAVAYKGLLGVERCFDALKHTVDVRPVFHRLDRRIRAHVTLCTLALLLERVIEFETKRPFDPIRREFQRLRAVQLQLDGQTLWESSRLTPDARDVLRTLVIEPPPRALIAPAA